MEVSPSFIADETDRNWANAERWWATCFPHGLQKSDTTGQLNINYWEYNMFLGPVWALIVFSSYFFLVVLPWSSYLPHTHPHTHMHTTPQTHTHPPHTHTCPQISTQPQTQGTTLEYQRPLYRLYMEDFSYISLRFWICFIKREKLQNLVLKSLFHIFFFCSCYFIMTESKSQRSLYEKMSSWVLHKIICLSPDYLPIISEEFNSINSTSYFYINHFISYIIILNLKSYITF